MDFFSRRSHSVKLIGIAAISAFVACAALPARGQDAAAYPEVEFDGLVFGDAYYVPSHHTVAGDGAAGLVMRRLYLTLDARFSDHWFARARVEANQDGAFETYTFDADWKDLYLGARIGRHKLLAGLTGTPTFDLIEATWGARYLLRTPMDLQGVASRDTGLFAQGPLNASGSLGYRLMWAAPMEFGKESNPNDRVLGAVSWSPDDRWVFDFYADHEPRDDNRDRTTWQVFAGYSDPGVRWGFQYSRQDRGADPPLELASGFVAIQAGENRSLIGRIDRLVEPSPRGDGISYVPFDPSAPATLYLGAWEQRLTPNFRLTPNLLVIDYDRDDEGNRPRTDVQVRVTAYLTF